MNSIIDKGVERYCFMMRIIDNNFRYGKAEAFMADIKFQIKEELGSISESVKGWNKELNLISWNDKEAKYDLRDWSPGHEKMGKGVTLTVDELKKLRDLLNKMEL